VEGSELTEATSEDVEVVVPRAPVGENVVVEDIVDVAPPVVSPVDDTPALPESEGVVLVEIPVFDCV